jgi:hypothetical protein
LTPPTQSPFLSPKIQKNPSETKIAPHSLGGLVKYKVTFVDGTKAKVKANSKAEAKQKAESQHNKPVSKAKEYGQEA